MPTRWVAALLVAGTAAGASTSVVEAAQVDTRVPVMTSFALSQGTGSEDSRTVSVTWTAQDASPLASIRVTLRRPGSTGGPDGVVESQDAGQLTAGRVDAALSWRVPDGSLGVVDVVLTDASGNQATYGLDGRVTRSPTTARGPSAHALDLAAAAVVLPAPVPPELTSMSVSTQTVRAGGPVDLSWATTPVGENGPPAFKVSLNYILPLGDFRDVFVGSAEAESQESFVPREAGVYKLNQVTVQGIDGSVRYYLRSGTRQTEDRAGGWSTSRHTFDFSAMDLTATPRAPVPQTRARPQGLDVRWPVSYAEAETATGFRVVLQPGGLTSIVRPVAVSAEPWSQGWQTVRFDHLANGRTYTVTVTPLSDYGDGASGSATGMPLMSDRILASRDLDGDRRADLVARQAGQPESPDTVYRYPFSGRSSVGGRVGAGVTTTMILAPWDLATTSTRSTLLSLTETGQVWLTNADNLRWNGLGAQLDNVWPSMRFADGGHDFDGDRAGDIVAQDEAGTLWLYRGWYGQPSRVRWPTMMGRGWSAMVGLSSVGDMSGDGNADIVAVDVAGDLWLYPGNGRGQLGARVRMGAGWQSIGAVFGLRDFTGDGRNDLGAIDLTGRAFVYPGTGRSSLGARTQFGSGWTAYF